MFLCICIIPHLSKKCLFYPKEWNYIVNSLKWKLYSEESMHFIYYQNIQREIIFNQSNSTEDLGMFIMIKYTF